MDAEELDERLSSKVKEIMAENQRQLLQEMNSIMNKISEQNSTSNEEQLLKISGIVATGEIQEKEQ